MPTISFTPHLRRHVACPPGKVDGATVREAMNAVFLANPPLRSYILDDQGSLRQHVMILVNGQTVGDRHGLSDPVDQDAEIYVMQALSGG